MEEPNLRLPPDAELDGDALVEPAVALVRQWLAAAAASERRDEHRHRRRFHHLTTDPPSVEFTMAFADRVMRPEDARVAARQLRAVTAGPLPRFLSPLDRAQLAVGARLSRWAPRLVMTLARRRLRALVGDLVVDRREAELARQLGRLRAGGFAVNVNLLGEVVLGHDEAERRRQATIDLLARDDVDYVSVKASSVTAQINLWGYADSVDRVKDGLRPILHAASECRPTKFVNLDMEEYKDLQLTLDAFTELLVEPALTELEAGIVLQAYLPDSFTALQFLTSWAADRQAAGGAGIKVRIVKGANLAMERVDAAIHGWTQAPYATKAETDANYKRMVDWLLDQDRTAAVRAGVASHNLFDVAWVHLLARHRGVADRVEFEMLHGMAPGLARTVDQAADGLLLYTPVVAAEDFDTALAYLFRRLEENSSGENFLRHLFDLDDPATFAEQRTAFEAAVAARWDVPDEPRRLAEPVMSTDGFTNEPDTDPTVGPSRERVLAAVDLLVSLGPVAAVDGGTDADVDVDQIVPRAAVGARRWQGLAVDERARLLRRAGDELAARRPELIAVMVHEAAKTVAEADTEVSEAVDFARYYADRALLLDAVDGARFEPLGVVVIAPPWNFPLAIPLGGALAALAAGNAAIVKPAPQTPRTARAGLEACWAAGLPRDALALVEGDEERVGTPLIAHDRVDGIILTGASETAELFRHLAPGTALFAETSGKNALVVLPDADLDLAVNDLVRSAFGHAGQKCSAASLAILVGDIATSTRFRRQLADATRGLRVGPSDDPATVVGPLIEPPSDKLRRALTTLEAGQSWLVEPRLIDAATNLWSPGIIDGVATGTWFHQTECFGPVLGLMAAADLDEAIAIQNSTAFGLTGGLHTLDPTAERRWLDQVEVGNAYVNRVVTGAIVRRQPFGGWRGSVVGPSAKAGGPNYVAQLGDWRDDAQPTLGADPPAAVAAVVAAWAGAFDESQRGALTAAVRSDAYWWDHEFALEHDPTGLFCEANVFRYRPLPSLELRIGAGATALQVVRVLAALARCGVSASVSVAPDRAGELPGVDPVIEASSAFWLRMADEARLRVRVIGEPVRAGEALTAATYVDERPPVLNGRVELARYLREQAVSRTLHRFGNLVGTRSASCTR